jgi:hypothetical protein
VLLVAVASTFFIELAAAHDAATSGTVDVVDLSSAKPS